MEIILKRTNILGILKFLFSFFIYVRRLHFYGHIIRQFLTKQFHQDNPNGHLKMSGVSFSTVQNIQGLPKKYYPTTLERRLTVRRSKFQSFLCRCGTPVQCFIRIVLLVRGFISKKGEQTCFFHSAFQALCLLLCLLKTHLVSSSNRDFSLASASEHHNGVTSISLNF